MKGRRIQRPSTHASFSHFVESCHTMSLSAQMFELVDCVGIVGVSKERRAGNECWGMQCYSKLGQNNWIRVVLYMHTGGRCLGG